MHNLGKKVLIIGCAGSGKTTLAKQFSKTIGLPIIRCFIKNISALE